MPNQTYRITEIVGTSPESVNAAIENGVQRAAKTLHGLNWFEVTEVRGYISEGAIDHYQVGLRIGFRLDD